MRRPGAPEGLSADSEEDERLPSGRTSLRSVGLDNRRDFFSQSPTLAAFAAPGSPVSLFRRTSFSYVSVPSVFVALCLGLLVACLSVPCAGQIVTYTNQSAPEPLHIAAEKGAFFLYGKNTKFYFPFISLFLSSSSDSPPAPTVTFKNVRLTAESSATVQKALEEGPTESSASPAFSARSPASLELALLPYAYVRTLFTSPTAAPFCCSAQAPSGEGEHPSFSIPTSFSPTNECPYPGALKRPITGDAIPLLSSSLGAEGGSTREPTSPRVPVAVRDAAVAGQYVCPLTLRDEGAETGERRIQMEIEESDIYFLVASNCGNFKGLTFEGEVAVRNAYGYLPGYEYPKIPFYFLFMLVYLVVCFVWGCLMYRQRANLITFHKFMLVVAVLGFLESLALFVYLYDYNMRGDRNKVLLVVSILVSVVKSIFSYMLVLLGAIGWSITVPVLEKKTVVRMQIIVVLYIILDTVRQVSDEFSNSHSLPLVLLLTCLIPISTLNGVLFYWIISSINNNIEMLQQQKQHEKLLIYRRLYAVLLLAIVLAIIDLLCQIYVASWDASDRWRDQWWLSDAIPHFLFLLVLAAMMAIWRPSQQSRRLAYFTELGDVDDLENHPAHTKNAADLHVWGEELDFHDHFSEEELEAGIPNFKLHSVGSMSDDGNLSDEDLQGDEEGFHTSTQLTPTSSQRLPTPTHSAGEGNKPQPQVVGRETLDDEVEMTTQDGASTNGRRLEHGQVGL
ncbi:YHL017Wp-like protein, related [Neospora caninum Liverpool]|uniref:YHL017Wp-like protein, related n=1 Tax=Neospora caninum (strain Liverpool) TaxID=572307 RepID=F0VMN8_NEOCL|nr:YHL017Wp-like protein, related [Neospora caninum Liverpool]CBZ54984.1 YHL017Wp-like protein, related [Neospora caninum Liverpool]CEL69707.1 TPA: YHL017Wp-like protein, related [Neospora caninum Liverpool]|eukprot:XP_003885012.1 YHL017Wp-like protein, related [Neospora caninum Liverpool]